MKGLRVSNLLGLGTRTLQVILLLYVGALGSQQLPQPKRREARLRVTSAAARSLGPKS